MSERQIITKDIKKSFGRLNVLNGVNISINQGDIYILFGSNGVGKTTFIKILSTILLPDSGELFLFGARVERRSKEIKARIGFMSHEPYLYKELTAFENLNFYANLFSIEDKNERIDELLKEVGLFHRSHDKVGSFSRGMKQRLSLARAILHSPDIIFMDEPYTGLDIKAQEILNKIIISLNQKGKIFFLITHDVGRGFEIANRSGILSNGQIVYEIERGEKKSFLEKYNNIIKGDTI
jgi:ABC-type multidrug transport system ATPase subunit